MSDHRSRCPRPRRQRVLTLAVAPLVAAVAAVTVDAPGFANVIIRNVQPGPGSTSNATPATAAAATPATASAAASDPTLYAYPFIPRINGFQPHVVFGLTNENQNDFYSPKSITAVGATPVPNPARYFVGTFDTGGQATIIGYDDTQAIDLFANGLEGQYSVTVGGASGTEDLDVSDALGIYATGLANATPGPSGPVVPVNSLKGMWNTSILTSSDPESILPNLIGNPFNAHWQTVIRNSQTQRMTVNGRTYQGPQVELRNVDTAIDNTFVSRSLRLAAGPGGAEPDATFFPDFFGSTDWSDNPMLPTTWNFMFTDVSLRHGSMQGSLTREFLFDTGAQVSVISTDTATDLGIDTGGSNPTPHDFTVEVVGVGGTTTVKGYYLDQFTIVSNGVDLEATNAPVIVMDLTDPTGQEDAMPGIIGMNLFNDRDLVVNAKVTAGSYLAWSEFPYQARWTGTAGGNWGDNSKWMLGVPWEAGAPANFLASASPQTINVEADYTFGRLTFDNAARYTLSGPGTIRMEEIVGNAIVQVNNGSHTITTPVELASPTNLAVIPAASTLTINSNVTAAVNGAGITKTGQGTAEVKRLVDIGPVHLQAGKLKILHGSGGAAGTSSIERIVIDAAATLDLTNNNLIIHEADVGAANGGFYNGVQGDVQRAYNFGSWNAPGLTTSMQGALDGITTIGVATGEQIRGLGPTDTDVWAGETINGASVIAMYTYAGDANLDGQVDAGDYGILDAFIQVEGATGYGNGDFNYDGFIDAADYGTIDNTIQFQGPPIATSGSAAAAVTAVPEPTGVAAAALLTAAALGTRRRRQRGATGANPCP